MIDRLRAFLGKPHVLESGVSLYSPTIDEIAEIGEIEYSIRISLSSFNPSKIFKLFNIDTDTLGEIQNANDYEIITNSHPIIINHICESLELFTKETVTFQSGSFVCDGKMFIDKYTYEEVVSLIYELNGIKNEKESLKFKGKKAKELFEKMNNILKQQQEKKPDSGLEIKDVLSILSNADGNGINVFNVSQLTIYQMYEHFERLNIKEENRKFLPVWANGHLKDPKDFPEWIIKTKL